MMVRNVITAPMGVSAGYDNFSEQISPQAARNYVKDTIKKIKGRDYSIFGGVAVYPRRFGCPKGGEPLGFIIGEPENESKFRDTLQYLQQKFKQEEVYVANTRRDEIVFNDSIGMIAVGFLPKADIRQIAEVWQKNASELEKQGKPYVTTVIHTDDTGHLFFQAEYNRAIYNDPEQWKKTAKNCLTLVEAQIKCKLSKHFRKTDLNFSILQKDIKTAEHIEKIRKKLKISPQMDEKIKPLNEKKRPRKMPVPHKIRA